MFLSVIKRKEWLFLCAFGFLQNPLAALLVWAVEGKNYLDGYTVPMYALSTGFGFLPLLVPLFFAFLFFPLRLLEGSNKIRICFWSFVGLAALLSIAAQYICWRYIASDAQAALLFLFLPVYVAGAIGVLFTVFFLLTLFIQKGMKKSS